MSKGFRSIINRQKPQTRRPTTDVSTKPARIKSTFNTQGAQNTTRNLNPIYHNWKIYLLVDTKHFVYFNLYVLNVINIKSTDGVILIL